MLFRVLSFIFTISSALGYSAGYDSCINVANHGSWATGCNSTLCANSPYVIQVMNNGTVVNSYVPTTKYTIQITSPMNFRGFILNSGLGSDVATFTTVAALQRGSGALTRGTDTHVRPMTSCTNGLTQTSATNVKQVSAFWTAPPAGAGFVTFKAIITVTQNGNNFVSHRILSEASINTGTSTHSVSVTNSLSVSPSVVPSVAPSVVPSVVPSIIPSIAPSVASSVAASLTPSVVQSQIPSESVSLTPTLIPSPILSESVSPSLVSSSLPSPSLTPSESVYPSSSSIALPSPSESVYPSSSSIALPSESPSPSPSSTYNGAQYLRTTNTAGVNIEGITVGTFVAVGAALLITVGSAIIYKNNKKKKAVSFRNIPVSDYVVPNPIDTSVTISRFSLTNKTKKEFSPMQSIA